MDEESIYSIIIILAFILGIIFFTGETEKDHISNLHGKERLKYAKEKALRKLEERTTRRVKELRPHSINLHPYEESETLEKTVCRSLFHISILLETYTLKNVVGNENYNFLVRYNNEAKEIALDEILKLLKSYSGNSSKDYRKSILLKICNYLYNKGCEKYPHEDVFRICKMYGT